jgi:hypothetical protein
MEFYRTAETLNLIRMKVYLIDSTVITLYYDEIFKGSGGICADGRRKGGLKVHMTVPVYDHSPCVVHIDEGASNDNTFHKYLTPPSGSTIIMDRGYRNYSQYDLWSSLDIRWVSRTCERIQFTTLKERKVSKKDRAIGFAKDIEVQLGFPQKKTSQVKARIIGYTDPETKKYLEFLTNDFKSAAQTVAELYKKRWGIELLFKRLKQNMPLQYFLGNNQNAIKIQIWCVLIADLLLNVIRRQVKRKWAFSTIVSLVRLHLFNYLNLYSFLENPESCKINCHNGNSNQLDLALSG